MVESVVSSVVKALRVPEKVYNIEVEGNHNYFAGGLLVHNCNELQAVAERVFRNEPKEYDLVTNVSPGTSKSTVYSILFNPWTWTRMPSARHLSACHADGLALDLANKSRWVIKGDKYRAYYPEVVLRDDQDAKGHYANTAGGERFTCTVAGKSPIGRHVHFQVVDDPIDPKKAVSEAEIKTAREFMTNILPSRKVDKKVSVMMLVMQRLHEDDPTGVLLELAKKDGAAAVRHICLPAALHEDRDRENVKPPELLARYSADGLMDPVRLPARELKTFRVTLGEYGYAGQFRQSPVPPGGGQFKCLVAGTLVSTRSGQKPIEEVRAGDVVATRSGYRKVLRSWCSGRATELITVRCGNTEVTSTPEHRFWVVGSGFVEARHLVAGQEVLTWNRWNSGFAGSGEESGFALAGAASRSWCGRITGSAAAPLVTATGTTRGRRLRKFAYTGELFTTSARGAVIWQGKEERTPFTGLYGESTAAKSLRGTLFTTRTVMRQIIASPTWSALPGKSTRLATRRSSLRGCPPCKNEWVRTGSEGTSRRGGTGSPGKAMSVFGAAESFVPALVARSVTALVPVRTATAVPVYDLEVEGAHEFIANGVLVHNSQYFNKRVRAAPHDAKRVRYWDRAASDGRGCQTAGVLLARDREGAYYVEHVDAGHWEPVERNQRMRAVALRDRARYPHNEPEIWVEREPGSSHKDAWLGIARALEGFVVREHSVSSLGSKVQRADPWSTQLAAGNVWVVEDGTWDVNGYVRQHVLFPTGTLLDQVDASSGAFAVFLRRGTGDARPLLQTLSLGPPVRKGTLRVVVCPRGQLEALATDERALLFSFEESPAAGDSNGGVAAPAAVMVVGGADALPGSLVTAPPPGPPPHALERLAGWSSAAFADLDPAECQEDWGRPLSPWGRPAEELVMRPEHGKALWSLLLKRRPEAPALLVLADSGGGDRRAISAAAAVCDALRLPRESIFLPGREGEPLPPGKGPNVHVYQTVRAARSLVIG